MDSRGGSLPWSVFDTVKFLPATPDALMAEINTAISSLEYAKASEYLSPSSSPCRENYPIQSSRSFYDIRIAEEAYKLGCAALSEGKVDEGLQSLGIALSKCPPDQADAIAKIQSLMSLAAQHFMSYK